MCKQRTETPQVLFGGGGGLFFLSYLFAHVLDLTEFVVELAIWRKIARKKCLGNKFRANTEDEEHATRNQNRLRPTSNGLLLLTSKRIIINFTNMTD